MIYVIDATIDLTLLDHAVVVHLRGMPGYASASLENTKSASEKYCYKSIRCT